MSGLWWVAFWHKLSNWQHWPVYLFYIYPTLYYFRLSFKYKSPFFYQLINPKWYNSGMKGDSKWNIYTQLCKHNLPNTLLTKLKPPPVDALKAIGYPMVAKPDIGQRGKGVSMIHNESALHTYLSKSKGNTILQSYSQLAEEWGIFYVRYPRQTIGRITSLIQRSFWQVEGDGKNSLWNLAIKSNEWPLQYQRMRHKKAEWQKIIPHSGQIITLEPIGNHNRGTRFLDKRKLISSLLVHRTEQLIQNLNEFYFGRLDVKIHSLDDFLNGGDAHIIEVNGFGAEPAHIYEVGYPICQAYRDVLYHIKLGFLIALENNELGHTKPSWDKGIRRFLYNETILPDEAHKSFVNR